MSSEEKAAKMQRWTRLGSVCAFLDGLGDWPRTVEEWATAYDLYLEAKRVALEKARG